jgi:hypothetical protein
MSSTYPNLTQDDINSITAFFNYVDTDQNGLIDVDEINQAMAEDFNQDGVITPDEAVQGGQQWMQSYFNAEDFNKDDKLSLSELLQYNNDTKGNP